MRSAVDLYVPSTFQWRATEETEQLDVESCNDLPWLLKFYNDEPVTKFDSEFSTRYIASLCVPTSNSNPHLDRRP
jgi:hypothetical protein